MSPQNEIAASLKRDGFGPDEIAAMLCPGAVPGEATPNPTQLRWGLNDVMWGDDDSVIVMLSGPNGEPYWLELDPDRAAALREDLAGPDPETTDQAAVLLDIATKLDQLAETDVIRKRRSLATARRLLATELRGMAAQTPA
jgi:hypothetical protein